MTGKDLYEITRAEAARLSPLEAGIAPLQPWEELPPAIQAAWEQKAVDQADRDFEPGRDRNANVFTEEDE